MTGSYTLFWTLVNVLYYAKINLRTLEKRTFLALSVGLHICDLILCSHLLHDNYHTQSNYFWLFLGVWFAAFCMTGREFCAIIDREVEKQTTRTQNLEREENILLAMNRLAISRHVAEEVVVIWGTTSCLINAVFNNIRKREESGERLTMAEKIAIRDRILPNYTNDSCIVDAI